MLSCVVRKFKMGKVLDKLKAIDPNLKHIKLDKKHGEAFPDLLHVLKCHAQATDYMIQFFKEPLVSNCTCEGCNKGLFKPVRMPRTIYDNVMKFPMPMPIPKPASLSEITTDLHYLSFSDAQLLPFTNEHQPSLAAATLRAAAKQRKAVTTRGLPLPPSRVVSGPIITKLKNRPNFKIGVSYKVRGVVECKNCHKPHCIYSHAAISQMNPPLPPPTLDDTQSEPVTAREVQEFRAMLKDKLHDATESDIYMCGMTALNHDDPCYDMFHCDPSLECNSHVD